MCIFCGNAATVCQQLPSRRSFTLTASAALALAASARGFAAPTKTPLKPENVISPGAALDRLMQGNHRYVDGVTRRHDFKHERERLAAGQNPFAGILGCSDSRVAPELAFDTSRGDLFVCRVAGNIANADVIASFEYALAILNTPLILVLGHENCGAVDSAIKSIKEGTTLPGHLPSLVDSISPAVKAALDRPGNVLDTAIEQNVAVNVGRLKAAGPIISKAVDEKKVRIVGAIYHLSSGRVEVLD